MAVNLKTACAAAWPEKATSAKAANDRTMRETEKADMK
jgi:hypothetical protein